MKNPYEFEIWYNDDMLTIVEKVKEAVEDQGLNLDWEPVNDDTPAITVRISQ